MVPKIYNDPIRMTSLSNNSVNFPKMSVTILTCYMAWSAVVIIIVISEVNVLWAAHQVHHSSEDYNLTTALRQSAFQTFGAWV